MFKISSYYENIYTGSIISIEAMDRTYAYVYYYFSETSGKISISACLEWIEISGRRLRLLRDAEEKVRIKIYSSR